MLAACAAPAPPSAPYCEGVDPALAVLRPPSTDLDASGVVSAHLGAWVDRLSASELRGRHATSDGARTVAALLAEQMAILGLEAPYPEAGYCQPFALLDGDAYNVVGHLPAAGPEATSEPRSRAPAILLAAHYDGQGVHPAGRIYPSADDNASGVAALLETARLARQRAWPFDLVFMASSAEEIGQVGAEAWVNRPSRPLEALRFMVNFDMVGRPWPGSPSTAIGYEPMDPALADTGTPDTGRPAAGAEALGAALVDAGAAAGVEVRRLSERFDVADMRSDSTVFRRHVPALYVSTGLHADYHQLTDVPEKVDVEQIGRAVTLTLSLLECWADAHEAR